MANDKLFQRRKAKGRADLRRKKAKRAPYDRVLIVCEGSKTENYYLDDLIECLKINSANVHVDPKSGSSPISVFKHAKDRFLEERQKNDPYDKVFCVFDKDTHGDSYEKAITGIQSFKPKGVFKEITSVPCFEYFLLLHFEFTTKAYIAEGKRSVCECVVKDLRNHLPDYGKGNLGLFEATHKNLKMALGRCKRANAEALKTSTDNPSTQIFELIEYLENIKSI